jgi:hypothetical protein
MIKTKVDWQAYFFVSQHLCFYYFLQHLRGRDFFYYFYDSFSFIECWILALSAQILWMKKRFCWRGKYILVNKNVEELSNQLASWCVIKGRPWIICLIYYRERENQTKDSFTICTILIQWRHNENAREQRRMNQTCILIITICDQ